MNKAVIELQNIKRNFQVGTKLYMPYARLVHHP